MARSGNTQYYSNFVGLDASSDPRAVSRNRLAYLVNMWRDYESEQGAAVETFPGFRRVAHSLGFDADGDTIGAVHGLYHFRSRKGVDYVVVHAGTKIYAFEDKALASGNYEEIANRSSILADAISDNDSTGFVFNNNLYILDGTTYFSVTDKGKNTPLIKVEKVDPYIPTTYYNGNLYEQRNMLSTTVYQTETGSGEDLFEEELPVSKEITWRDMVIYDDNNDQPRPDYIDGYKSFGGLYEVNQSLPSLNVPIKRWKIPNGSNFIICPEATSTDFDTVNVRNMGNNSNLNFVYILQNRGLFHEDHTSYNHAGLVIESNAFENCANLKKVHLQIANATDSFEIKKDAFKGCNKLSDIFLYSRYSDSNTYKFEDGAIPPGVTVHKLNQEPPEKIKRLAAPKEDSILYKNYIPDVFTKKYILYEPASTVTGVMLDNKAADVDFFLYREEEKLGEDTVEVVKYVCFIPEDVEDKKITLELEVYPNHFATSETMMSFQEADIGYKKTSLEAIFGCTKSAVYDGRIFLTGNPELPNTVFYSQRNLTGANDPTYFGVYNYFNDGQGNTPNVDILSTPSMLMVIKGNTVQDGSVYYHVAASNTDEKTKDLLPKIYPSTQGAAGLGSAGDTSPSRLSCNFLDDPVFISKRGVEAVGKETVNLERTIQHRSSNIDRLLIREDLTHASLAEWKKYLVVCCDGHMYLADSRYMTQHADGSFQYEWYYLEGVGTYERYIPVWRYLDYMPVIDHEGLDTVLLDQMLLVGGELVGSQLNLKDKHADLAKDAVVYTETIYHPDDSSFTMDLYYVIEDGVKYIVEANGNEMQGVGEFFGATKILAVEDRLIFGTNNGDICIINTDMRGVSVDDRFVDYDKIDRSFYSFNGVAYLSGCSLRLDDCDAKSMSKNTVCNTTVARFKMMPGSHCTAMVTTNGRDWQRLGEAFSSRFDFADVEFSNFSFTENENNVVVFPEISRGWVNKQYYFYSDRFEAPFGLYELSYQWYVSGKIRY